MQEPKTRGGLRRGSAAASRLFFFKPWRLGSYLGVNFFFRPSKGGEQVKAVKPGPSRVPNMDITFGA